MRCNRGHGVIWTGPGNALLRDVLPGLVAGRASNQAGAGAASAADARIPHAGSTETRRKLSASGAARQRALPTRRRVYSAGLYWLRRAGSADSCTATA